MLRQEDEFMVEAPYLNTEEGGFKRLSIVVQGRTALSLLEGQTRQSGSLVTLPSRHGSLMSLHRFRYTAPDQAQSRW